MTRINVWILGSSGNLGRALAQEIDATKSNVVNMLYLVDQVAFPSCYPLSNCNTKFLEADIADGDFIQALEPNLQIPHLFINLVAKDYPVTSAGLCANSTHPFSLNTEEYNRSMAVTAGTTYNLVRLIIEKQISSAHLVLIGTIYNYMLPDPAFYSPDKSLYKPVSYSSAKHAQKALMHQAAVYLANVGGRCNSVAFGGINLDQSAEFKQAYSLRAPQMRLVPLNDAIKTLIWLAFDSPPSVNGAELLVDGGMSLT